jgi:cell division transport system permease protein
MRLAFREALLAFRRWPALSVLSVTTIAFALFVVGLFGLVALNLQRALQTIEERVEIVVYLLRGTPVEVVTVAIGDIQAFPEVSDVTYVTTEEAIRRARLELVEFQGLFRDLETNPLPASLEMRLRPGFRDAESVRSVAQRLEGLSFAEDIRYGRDWVLKLDRLRNISAVVGLVIGGAFAVASIIIIGTTVRMSVLQRSREINIMRLVGATDGFIRSPFLLEGCVKGALGGIVAVGLSYGAFLAVDRLLLAAYFFTPEQAGVIIIFGTALGFAASASSVGRHLTRV